MCGSLIRCYYQPRIHLARSSPAPNNLVNAGDFRKIRSTSRRRSFLRCLRFFASRFCFLSITPPTVVSYSAFTRGTGVRCYLCKQKDDFSIATASAFGIIRISYPLRFHSIFVPMWASRSTAAQQPHCLKPTIAGCALSAFSIAVPISLTPTVDRLSSTASDYKHCPPVTAKHAREIESSNAFFADSTSAVLRTRWQHPQETDPSSLRRR